MLNSALTLLPISVAPTGSCAIINTSKAEPRPAHPRPERKKKKAPPAQRQSHEEGNYKSGWMMQWIYEKRTTDIGNPKKKDFLIFPLGLGEIKREKMMTHGKKTTVRLIFPRFLLFFLYSLRVPLILVVQTIRPEAFHQSANLHLYFRGLGEDLRSWPLLFPAASKKGENNNIRPFRQSINRPLLWHPPSSMCVCMDDTRYIERHVSVKHSSSR